jgi:AcrR family transcriptional regulator
MPRADRTPRHRLDADARREGILDAAREMYAAHPYSEVSTQQIADAAGASAALVFHYFGSKAGLYTAVVTDAIAGLSAAHREADARLATNAPARDRVRTSIGIYLDHIASHPQTWAWPLRGGVEPVEAQQVRRRARAGYVQALSGLLGYGDWARHRYALWGYFGFLDEACLAWVDKGCPSDDREQLIEASLGALEGALGDWGS